MIINHDPESEKKKAFEEKLNRSEDEQKDSMLSELRDEPTAIICLAVMYAKMFEQVGFDVTERWKTAEHQISIIQKIYNEAYSKGLNEGIAKAQAIERAENAQPKPVFPKEEFLDIGHEITINTIRNAPQYRKKGSTKKKRKR